MTTPEHPHTTRISRFLAVALVGLYVLASVRALVPELCLTMRAVEAAAQGGCAPAAEVAGHGCCTKPQSSPSSGSGGGAPVEENCPFCHLAKALMEPLERVVLAAPVEGAFQGLPAAAQDPLLDAVAQDHPGRAPPVSA